MTEKQGGVPLPPGEVHIFYDPQSVPDTAQQPQAQQVAVFEASPNQVNGGKTLDVNQHFVVYAVKNGLIRILHRHSPIRSLLRGHEGKTVTDIQFFQNGDVLGTVGGNVIIWRVYERSQEVVAEKLLEIPATVPDMSRLIWHPFNPNLIWVIHRNRMDMSVATLVETTRIKTIAHPTESHAVCMVHNQDIIMEGATQLAADGANLNDLAWSFRDARHVMTAHDDGTIGLWDIKADYSAPTADGVVPALCKGFIHDGEDPITRCIFLTHDNVATNYGDPPDSTITTAFCTASQGNSCITIWSPFTETAAPTKLQIFQIDHPSPSYNLDVCFGPIMQGGEPPAYFLMLSDRSDGQMFVIALKSIWSNYEPRRPLVEGFEYLVPFLTKFPTYSLSITACPAENLDENAPVGGLNFDMRFYALQSKMVQQMSIPHYMCLPPTSLWEADTYGVRMQTLAHVLDKLYEEDYELFSDSEDDDDEEDYTAPDPSSLPQPDGLNNPKDNGNSFANWLGAIAAKSPVEGGSSSENQHIPPPPTAPTAPPPGMLSNVSAPPVQEMSNNRQGSGLLSPMEILSSSSHANETQGKKSKQRGVSDNARTKMSLSPKRKPVPDGKIVILKRDQEPPSAAADASAPGTTSNLEETLKKAIASHFKNQEKTIINEIQRAVRSEIKQTVLPELNKTVAQTVEQSVVKPLQSSMETFITKAPAVKTDIIVKAVTSGVEEPLKEAFTESMKSMMIPAFEAATRQMFSQVATSLANQSTTRTPLNDDMNAKIDALTAMVQALTVEVSQLRKTSGAAAGAPPPPPEQVDQIKRVQSEVLMALQSRNYEAAFTKALSASTIDTVVFCCNSANLSDVLGGSQPTLSQPILLCLMQQLGSVLLSTEDADLQMILAWLQELALTLDTTHESIHRHVPSVLQQLASSITAKMKQGDPALRRPLQMLFQVIRGMQR